MFLKLKKIESMTELRKSIKSFIIVIPARLKSKRLPGKPLKLLNGVPMIVRTYNQCRKATHKDNIIIVTDSVKILKVCDKLDIPAMMTSSQCLTGTDRVAEVSKKIKRDYYINVQGDEPIIPPNDIKKIISETLKQKKFITNGYTKIKNKKLFFNINIPKLVFNKSKELLYMSRAPIPLNKTKSFIFGYRLVCVYGYPKKVLEVFLKNKKKTKLEQIEDIETLRFLELGFRVKMVELSDGSISVDTMSDVKKVSNKLSNAKKN